MYIIYTSSKTLPQLAVCLDFTKCKCRSHKNMTAIIRWYQRITPTITYTGDISNIDKLLLDQLHIYPHKQGQQSPILIICNPHARPTILNIKNAMSKKCALVSIKSIKKGEFGIKIIREALPLAEHQHRSLLPLCY